MTHFNLAAYIPLALRTEAPLPTVFDRLDHALLGLLTETGEFITEIKRVAIYGKALDSLTKDGKTTLAQHIAEEIGDTLWYVAIAVDALDNPAALFQLELASGTYPATTSELIGAARNFAISNGQIAQVLSGTPDAVVTHEHILIGALADILHDLNVLANVAGIPLQAIADDNIAKLALRYPEKFSAEAAEARADKGGLDARNS